MRLSCCTKLLNGSVTAASIYNIHRNHKIISFKIALAYQADEPNGVKMTSAQSIFLLSVSIICERNAPTKRWMRVVCILPELFE